MAMGISALSFKRPELTEEEKEKERRQKVFRESWFGSQDTEFEDQMEQQRLDKERGLSAISDLAQADKFAGLAGQDLRGIEAKRLSEQDDPEAMQRYQSSAPLQEHIQDLQRIKDRPKEIQTATFQEGLSSQPDLQAYLKQRGVQQEADAKTLAATQKAEQEQQRREQTSKALQQFAEKHGLQDEAQRDLINLLANVGETEEGIKQAIELSGREAGKVETLQEQDFDVEKEDLLQDNRKELERLKQQGRRELEQTRNQLKIALQKDKPLERKSTTQSAKIVSDNGFALDNVQILRDLLTKGDANIFSTSTFGNFTNPQLVNAIEQLTEIHGRERSGAAISASEWKNFRKQVLNKKFLLTPDGKKEALENIDRFIGRYYAKAEQVTNDENWYENYKAAKQRGIQVLSGERPGTTKAEDTPLGLEGTKAQRYLELKRKQREGTLR